MLFVQVGSRGSSMSLYDAHCFPSADVNCSVTVRPCQPLTYLLIPFTQWKETKKDVQLATTPNWLQLVCHESTQERTERRASMSSHYPLQNLFQQPRPSAIKSCRVPWVDRVSFRRDVAHANAYQQLKRPSIGVVNGYPRETCSISSI